MSIKKNKFSVKSFQDNNIVVEEYKRSRSPLTMFMIKNGKLIFAISFMFSITVFIIAFYLVIVNLEGSSIVMYESNGVKVTFDGTDNSLLNGTPITDEYAEKVLTSVINVNSDVGVVIKVDEFYLKKIGRTIVYYSDRSALIKDNDGSYLRVLPVNGEYGVDSKKGHINSMAETISVKGYVEKNKELGISILYLSDGSMEVSNGNNVFFVRNSDITNTKEEFYTNLSGVSLPINKENGKTYYSDGTIRENNGIIVDGKRYEKVKKENIYQNMKVIYYENGYAEIIKGNLSIMVRNSEHVIYDEDSLEIKENVTKGINIKDIMDIKEIELVNNNTNTSHFIIVLEETNDYKKHNVNKRLDNNFIHYSIYINNNKKYNNVLDNNLKGSDLMNGLNLENNTYLLYEGNLDGLSTANVKLGMWIDYEDITNEYMNSAFIGTVKLYVESYE